jgi:predicted RNase H-like HicB family nuclease
MQTYIAVVNKDADSAFGLWFPDVAGCFSAADEDGDIIRNAIEALTLHLDGIERPTARGVDKIAQAPDVADALQSGAYLLAIPFVTTQRRAVRINLSLDKGMVDAIDTAADLRGLTRSAFVAEAALNEIRGR